MLLAGEAGVGKTRLGSECLRLATAEGFMPLRVGATQAASVLPFGAFASFVPTLQPGLVRAELLREVADSIVARGNGRPIALFVDDVHLLDASSAALTHLLASGDAPLFVIATLRSGERAQDSIIALWKDGLAERLELDPLDPVAIGELVSAALGGPVDPASVRTLWERTRGNALFVRELVIAGLESGVLRNTDGLWRLSGSLAFSPRLLEIVDARLGELSDEVRRALGLVAVGEPLGADVFHAIDTDTDLEALEEHGLVAIQQSDRRVDVRLAHPLYGEVLRLRMSPLRLRTLARTLASALQVTGARRREDNLRIAALHLDGAGTTRPDVMLQAASTARERFDLPLAERLARAAVESGAGFDAQLLLGQLFWLQGRAAEAERHLRSLAGAAPDDRRRAALATTRMDVLGFSLNRIADCVGVADAAERTIGDLAWRDLVTAYRARSLGWMGRHAEAVEVAEPLLSRATGPTLIAASMAAGTSMICCGRSSDAITTTQVGLTAHLALEGPPLPFGPSFHLYIRTAALAFCGRLAEAEQLGSAQYEHAVVTRSPQSRAFFAMWLSTTHAMQGRLATAVRVGRSAAADCRQLNIPFLTRVPLIWVALAFAMQGAVDAARSVHEEIEALGVLEDLFCGPDLLRARAWLAAADGVPSDGHACLEQAVAMAQAGGGVMFERAALHDLARLGRAAQVAPRLRELAETTDGPLPPAYAAHATALADHDAAGLDAASSAFERTGAILLAAEAAADSAVAWRRALDPRRAASAERRARILAGRCEGARTPALTATAAVRAALTPRELEIARLAASGLANKAIAARLFLSHRTVENKLHACYMKLGASGRDDLARVLKQG